MLLNPREYDPAHFDAETRRLLRATIDWFEQRGKAKLTEDYHNRTFYADFIEFAGKEGLFSTFLTPSADAGGHPDKRWDTARVAALSEILGFYGLNYWYPWQVTILGLGPVWQSANAAARERAAAALDAGGVGAFGLSEKDHGADIYSSDLVLTKDGDGYRATGSKYYIGNGNCARTVSVFGRIDGVEGPDQYVFFYADSEHPNYHVVKNVVPSQMYVAEFRLEDYPVRAEDILHVGAEAFSAALNTVNIGKFNLCFGGIGMATHSLYEAITHAHNRVLYGKPVTDFPHVRREFVEAYARLTAMKLFSDRAVDYFRSANPDDRRYLLFNPITKMKVTTEAQKVIGLVADVVAAKGFEADTYLAMSKNDIDGLPKLEGTVAVNLALIAKFMPNYLFAPQEYPPVPTRTDAADDEFLFRQGPARGLSKVRFHDWKTAYAEAAHIPNVALFTEQAGYLVKLLTEAAPDEAQQADLDFGLALTELFTLIVYGQLVLEQARITGLDDEVADQIFAVLVQDFSVAAVDLHGKASSTDAQQAIALAALRKPVVDAARFENVWARVRELSGVYAMQP
ncbi:MULTISPECIES: acyl-CoA dehydrogenase [unclassified Amycolatopsis]|uniref:acyl-CoA dehydrogenase n=1 Tax=unclassified Amycolatopsis TaxID=2618356 RepID=UPI0028744871|nr:MULTISPECIES: acyl-CoA dehydrogenase [unclassified Amycolatopsis]MDS0140682.1 acyl-CoA dehydrogenase [Amycolatopsis sp. 505]MDS0149332.1 acyl-CoA dehydrogenase [Amycolatopsis sp. CM201R]